MDDVPRLQPETANARFTPPSEPASAATVPWWKNLSVTIAALAFVMSVLTSLISAYTAYHKDVHDRQAELSAVVQKILQIPMTRASLAASIQSTGNMGLEPVFVEQNRMLTAAAYGLARRLGSNAPAPELMTIAPMLASFENYRAAKQIWRQATLVADNFSDEVSALRAYGMGMVRFAQNDRERAEGEQVFELAMNIGSKYPDVGSNPAEISYSHALTQIAWTDVWSGFDCAKAEFHLQQADTFVQAALAGPGGSDVQSRSRNWHEALGHCDESRRLPFQWHPGMRGMGGPGSPPPGRSDPMVSPRPPPVSPIPLPIPPPAPQ